MAGSMKDIKLRIKSVESTMQITKPWSWWLPPKCAAAKERWSTAALLETLHET